MAALASDWLRHFRPLLWNRWAEFNETWQEARYQRPLQSLCFSGCSEKQDGRPGLWWAETFSTSPLKPLNGIQRNLTGSKISKLSTNFLFFGPIDKNKMAALASDWLRHFRLLLWNRWAEFNETWQEARYQRPLQSLCFSGCSEKQDGRPGLWLAETFSTSPLKPLNGIKRNLTVSKISTPSTKFVFFGLFGKTRRPPWPLIGWDFFDFSSETAERNSTKLDRKQDLKALYQFFIFRADRKNKMAALASDWLRLFRLLLWNRWTELNETWQEASSQRPLQSLCFSGCSEKQDGRPGLWLAETFSTSPLKPLNGIQRNLTGSKISKLSTNFFIFRADRKNKMDALASDWLRHFRLLLWNRWTEFNETWQEARSQRPLPSLCFSGRSEKRNGRPGLWFADTFLAHLSRRLKWAIVIAHRPSSVRPSVRPSSSSVAVCKLSHFWLLLSNRWTEFNETWQEARSQRPLPSLCFSGRLQKQDSRSGLWLAETFSTSPLKPLNGIQRTLTGSKISTPFTKFVFFMPIAKTKLPPWPLIGWDIFDFSSETTQPNSTKLDRKQDLNALYQVCVFQADQKIKMAALASDWLRHFQLLCRNRWMEFNETWQETRS